MTQISMLALEQGAWAVTIAEGDRRTDHKVVVPEPLLDDVRAVVPDVTEEEVVRESIGFLLDREPATAILAEFSLDDIGRFFDGYTDELLTRLQNPG